MKTISKIFPFYILLLTLYPIFIGYFIQPELVNSRYFLIHTIWLPLLTIPFLVFKKKSIAYFFTIVLFVIGIFEISHWAIIKGPITITSLLVISNTNFQESLEFLDLTSNIKLLYLLPYFIIFLKAIQYIKRSKTQYINYKIVSLVALTSIVFIAENYYNNRLLRKGAPQSVNLIFTFASKLDLYKEILKNPKPKKIQASATNPKGQTFVLVLGESLSRNHMSLYGYNKATNPKLVKRTDLNTYTNVVSPYSTTLQSVFSILTTSNLQKPIEKNEAIDIIDIFHSAGFKTHWISNQSPFGIWDNLITLFAKKSDHFTFVNTSSNSSFEATLNVSYDEKVLAPFQKALQNNTENKLIIIHLMGSHSNYAKRYPAAYQIFSGSDTKTEVIAAYDNSVRYNDYVLDTIITMLANHTSAQNTHNSLIYLSDHGENVYDYNNQVGHGYSGSLPKQNVDIPFILWTAPNFKTKNLDSLKTQTHRPYVSDDLFHSIIDLNQIETPYFEAERSVFNQKFNSKRKRILVDKQDYDTK